MSARGAFGLRLTGLAGDEGQVSAPAHWPTMTVTVQVGPPTSEPNRITSDDALVHGHACTTRMVRDPLAAELTLGRAHPTREALQPFLGTAAAVASHWLQRTAFHSGAFLTDDGDAIAVLGAKGAGKSTLLATLAMARAPILTDDVLVVDGPIAFAGPRAVDLRTDAAAELGVGESLGTVGMRERVRLLLPPVDPEVRLRAWIVPEWGDRLELVAVPLAQRIPLLLGNLALTVEPPSPTQVLDLATAPMWRLIRPRRWSIVNDVVEMFRDRSAELTR